MRAVRIHAHGGPEVLRVDDVPEPEPGPGDLLVQLRATSVNHRDIWMRRGHPHPAYRVELPAILGIDVCADVRRHRRRGGGVPRRRPRHREPVHARAAAATGACAAVSSTARTSASTTAPTPSASSCLRASPRSSIRRCRTSTSRRSRTRTSRPGRCSSARLPCRPADTVFVWAGTSGLGSAAIEIAKLAGARVIASAGSPRRSSRCCVPGRPDLVLDHHAPDLVERVLEATGGERRDDRLRAHRARRPGSGRWSCARRAGRSSAPARRAETMRSCT